MLESDPPRPLVMSWASPADAADKARHSRVAIDIERVGVLSSLKSFLETGRPLKSWKLG